MVIRRIRTEKKEDQEDKTAVADVANIYVLELLDKVAERAAQLQKEEEARQQIE